MILILHALNGQELVKEGNQWNIVVYPTFYPITNSYSVKIEGDTVLDNTTYKMVQYSYDSLNTEWGISNHFLRQDTSKKVFFKNSGSEEILLYDFNLQVNDTFQIDDYCILIVTATDTVYLNSGEPRKRLELEIKNEPDWGKEFWIDGIGSNFGVLSHFGFCYYDYSDAFLCFYQNDELIYPENPPSCFITGTEDINLNDGIKIYPNPSSTNLIVEDKLSIIKSYTIFNPLGEMMIKDKINNSKTTIETSNILSGFYYIILEDKNGRKLSMKLIKQ